MKNPSEKEKKRKPKRNRKNTQDGRAAKHKKSLTAREAVMAVFEQHPAKSISIRQVHRTLKAKDLKEKAAIEALVLVLVQEKKLIRTQENQYQLAQQAEPDYVIGKVDFVNPEFVYVITDDASQTDIWVHKRHINTALDGDVVKVMLHRFRKSEKPEGEIVEIVQRSRTEFVGRIEISPRYAFVVPDKRKMFTDIFVSLKDTKNAKHNDKVIVEITDWDSKAKNPVGKVKEVIGQAGEHETEMHSILAEYDLPYQFDPEVLEAAEAIAEEITHSEIARRRDYRQVLTFTIDPEDAQDFDDAISIKTLQNGNYEIGVHIADVTHYIKPGTILEEEAYRRATSVYLVDRCVPMLPEKLSNKLCSLRPNEEKLTFSAIFEMTPRGRIVERWLGRTVTLSQRRFTYEEAQEVIESGEGDHAEELQTLNKLSKILNRNRIKAGAIIFETTEVKFRLDENKRPVEIITKVRKDAHKLVEEFMLLANRSVAEFVFKQRKGALKNTMVYRVHAAPDLEKVQNFATFANQFGHKLQIDTNNIAGVLNDLAQRTEGRPEQGFLQSLAIRSMAKARYTTEAQGHFGLAFDHYTHFTSPIRRYPDMMVHRLLQHYLDGGAPVEAATWEAKCKHASEMEKRAADAERASVKYKQVELMQYLQNSREGRLPMAGVITGVTEWGIYVEVESMRCEGMVRLADMNDDYYEFDEKKFSVVGRRYQKVFQLGGKVRVRIKSTDLERRTIDFFMVDNESE